MVDIDSIRINFDQEQLWILNLCLGFLMFGVALELKLIHFKYLLEKPKLAIIGLMSQLIWLPLLTLGLVYLFNPPLSMAMGMVIVAACPGGNVSNFAVHLAKANSALSVLLTSITTLAAVVITPGYFIFLSKWLPGVEEMQQGIYVSPYELVTTIFQLIIVPLALGMIVNKQFPKFTNRIKKPVKILSIVIFFGFIIVAVFSNLQNIFNYLYLVFFIVLLHNTLALATGYYWSRINGLSKTDARAITLETGIQNSGLGLILIFNFFEGLGGMALIAAWWGIWHLVSAFTLATYWSRNP